jgi:hypothetical protein
MYIIKKTYNTTDLQNINNIYVREVYNNNRCYNEYYKILYNITVINRHILYNKIGEQILYHTITNKYRSKLYTHRLSRVHSSLA